MKLRIVGLVAFAVTVGGALVPGCTTECTTDDDCARFGENTVCSANHCVRGEEEEEEGDAGDEDGGGQDDGGVSDAGPIEAGGACDPSAANRCTGAFRCWGVEDGGGECRELWIALTTTTDATGGLAGTTEVTLAPFHDAGTPFTFGLTQSTRWPRWSADGRRVAFVSSDSGRVELHVGELDAGQRTVIDGDDAGTADFPALEWEPGSVIAWTRTDGGSHSGIFSTDPETAGQAQLTSSGSHAEWRAAGLAYSTSDGVFLADADGANATLIADGGEIPQVSSPAGLIAFERGVGGDSRVTDADLDHALWVVPEAGGAEQLILDAVQPAGATPGHAAAYPAWSADGQLLAYVKVNYELTGGPPPGNPRLCTVANCGVPAQQVFVQAVDATGAPSSAAVLIGEGTLPAFSPEGRWLAYVLADTLTVVELDDTGAATATSYTRSFGVPLLTRGGDDARPRWQPK